MPPLLLSTPSVPRSGTRKWLQNCQHYIILAKMWWKEPSNLVHPQELVWEARAKHHGLPRFCFKSMFSAKLNQALRQPKTKHKPFFWGANKISTSDPRLRTDACLLALGSLSVLLDRAPHVSLTAQKNPKQGELPRGAFWRRTAVP